MGVSACTCQTDHKYGRWPEGTLGADSQKTTTVGQSLAAARHRQAINQPLLQPRAGREEVVGGKQRGGGDMGGKGRQAKSREKSEDRLTTSEKGG
ncbi:hypothetical protein E2C01_039516 [Portunus trituberculatus]|uniref:Uncharacterized protein n=1 Tax=Portunus trituberculatus TaxID=210409 RepID=A0A5B7FEY0_PORTR|nr:hypothetical protein [Portunus trituberculatus]